MIRFNLIGDIDEEAYKSFVELLDGTDQDLTMELASHGGDALVALAFHDKIKSYKGNVAITASGIVASAAVLILAAGDKRLMRENAWVMVHEDVSLVDKNDRVTRAETQVKISRRLEIQWNTLLARSTGTDALRWEDLHAQETWLSAKECEGLGLIDKIIGG